MIILQNVTMCFRWSCCHHDDAPDCAGRLYMRVDSETGRERTDSGAGAAGVWALIIKMTWSWTNQFDGPPRLSRPLGGGHLCLGFAVGSFWGRRRNLYRGWSPVCFVTQLCRGRLSLKNICFVSNSCIAPPQPSPLWSSLAENVCKET